MTENLIDVGDATNITVADTSNIKRRGDGPQLVYDYLLNKIVSLRLTAGVRIEERVIVEELGISRTPVRQAFMRMATEGLIELLPNHGARIPPLDIEEVRSFLEAYEFVQLAVVHLAAMRRTDQDMENIYRRCDDFEVAAHAKDIQGLISANKTFHLAIAKAGKNSHMERLLGDLLVKALRLDWFWYARPFRTSMEDGVSQSIIEHRNLVEAIQSQDLQKSERYTREHVQSFRIPLLEYLGHTGATEFEVSCFN